MARFFISPQPQQIALPSPEPLSMLLSAFNSGKSSSNNSSSTDAFDDLKGLPGQVESFMQDYMANETGKKQYTLCL